MMSLFGGWGEVFLVGIGVLVVQLVLCVGACAVTAAILRRVR